MTCEEIIKALECCSTMRGCDETCPMLHNGIFNQRDCKQHLITQVVDLINRQKAEIEHLKLTTIIGEVREIPMEHKSLALVSWEHILVKAVKAEAIKEFAERLKEEIGNARLVTEAGNKTTWNWAFEDVDRIVKELIEEYKA